MKTNITLGAILIILLGIAYYSEEVQKEKTELKLARDHALIKSLDIKKIHLAGAIFEKQGLEWTTKGEVWPLNQAGIEQFFKIIQSLQVKDEVSIENEDEFFRRAKLRLELIGTKNKRSFLFGDVSEATGRFYVKDEVENKIYIVEDSSILDLPYTSEREYHLKKYLRLVNILENGNQLFWQSNLLKALKISQIKSLNIDSIRNRPLDIDFTEKKTDPQIFLPLKYKDFSSLLNFYFSQIKILKVIDQGQNILTDLRSTISIEAQNNFRLNYFAGLNDEFGQYIKIDGINAILKVEMDLQNIFFLSAQDFWQKKFYFKDQIDHRANLGFELSFDDSIFWKFTVYDLENFKIKAELEKVSFSKVHMNVLFNLLLNLADFSEALFVEKKPENQLQLTDQIYINLLNSRFILWMEHNAIRVYDRGFELLYFFPEQTTRLNQEFFRSVFTVTQK